MSCSQWKTTVWLNLDLILCSLLKHFTKTPLVSRMPIERDQLLRGNVPVKVKGGPKSWDQMSATQKGSVSHFYDPPPSLTLSQ